MYTTFMSESDTQYRQALDRGHQRLLSGPDFFALRGRTPRRWLVLAVCGSLALYFAGSPLHKPWLTLLGLVLFFTSSVLVRFATRGVADLPASALDERQLVVRNAVYVASYRLAGGLVVLVIGVAELLPGLVVPALLASLFALLVTPSCIVAWTEREL